MPLLVAILHIALGGRSYARAQRRSAATLWAQTRLEV